MPFLRGEGERLRNEPRGEVEPPAPLRGDDEPRGEEQEPPSGEDAPPRGDELLLRGNGRWSCRLEEVGEVGRRDGTSGGGILATALRSGCDAGGSKLTSSTAQSRRPPVFPGGTLAELNSSAGVEDSIHRLNASLRPLESLLFWSESSS